MKKITGKLLTVFSSLAFLLILLLIGNKVGNEMFPVKEVAKVLIKEGEIQSRQTVYAALRKDFPDRETAQVCGSLGTVFDTKNDTRHGHKYKIYYSTYQTVLKFIYLPSPLVNYVVDRSSTGFIASTLVPEIDEKLAAVKGTINSSLYEGMQKAGVDGRTIMNFADIFQWQIDFFTDVRPDDRFLLVFKQYYVDGDPVESGPVLFAGYKGKVGNYSAIRFQDDKFPGYYDADGNSFKKQFLKAPLSFTRITSRFSYRRKHPILKYVRPHLGIDYAAPMGTPVSTIGSGKVIFAGWKGGYGRTVIVRHNLVYITQYGHLKGYAGGIKKGIYVKQGQVIGYVGSSGISTGPHLDFRINKNGGPVNFLNLKFPPAKSVSKKNKKEFNEKVDELRLYLNYFDSDYFSGKIALIEDYEESIKNGAVSKTKL